jgi:hypothetical protein
MNQQSIRFTQPMLSDGSTVRFSAFSFGWGYCAFALPFEVVCEQLGAASTAPNQILLAFELGKQRILRAVEQQAPPDCGARITISAGDL